MLKKAPNDTYSTHNNNKTNNLILIQFIHSVLANFFKPLN